MKNKLEKLYITVGRSLFQFGRDFTITKISNGYIFDDKFYAGIDEVVDALNDSVTHELKSRY